MPSDDAESRRQFLGGIFTSAGKVVTRRLAQTPITGVPSAPSSGSFLSLMRPPDSVRVLFENEVERLDPLRGGVWSGDRASVKTYLFSDRLRLTLECPDAEPKWVAVRWQGTVTGVRRYLCPHGASEWRSEDPDRPMRDYFLANDGKRTHGYGVAVGPSALCHWIADRAGITLWLDVRSGSLGLQIGERELEMCEVLCREGDADEPAFIAHREFCRTLSPRPRLPGHPVYGMTDRHRDPSATTLPTFLESARVISELSPNETNRPFCLLESPNLTEDGFESIATDLRGVGVRAGVALQPLEAFPATPEGWRLSWNPQGLDPTHPEVSEQVGERVAQLVETGFELVKCRFPDLVPNVHSDESSAPRTFHNRSRTNAEILTHLYSRARVAAGGAILHGENVDGHLAAGVFEIATPSPVATRRDWESFIRSQVNRIAFQGARHGHFYSVDCSGGLLKGGAHDRVMADWLRFLGQSGTTTFLSVETDSLGVEEWTALRDAFGFAALEWPVAEPLDWTTSACPKKWRLRDEKAEFEWSTLDGPSPFS